MRPARRGLYDTDFTVEERAALAAARKRPYLEAEADLLRVLIRRGVVDAASSNDRLRSYLAIGQLIGRLVLVQRALHSGKDSKESGVWTWLGQISERVRIDQLAAAAAAKEDL